MTRWYIMSSIVAPPGVVVRTERHAARVGADVDAPTAVLHGQHDPLELADRPEDGVQHICRPARSTAGRPELGLGPAVPVRVDRGTPLD